MDTGVERRGWSVEDGVHWVLDVDFRESQSRVRSQNAADDLSRLRRFALSLLEQDVRAKVGIRERRLGAAWDANYLLHILGVRTRSPCRTPPVLRRTPTNTIQPDRGASEPRYARFLPDQGSGATVASCRALLEEPE